MLNDKAVSAERSNNRIGWIRAYVADVPLLAWLLGALVAVLLEQALGDILSDLVGLPKIPVLFGCMIMLKEPTLIPSALIYVALIYGVPIMLLGKLLARPGNWMAARMISWPIAVPVVVHLLLVYAIMHVWSDLSL